MACWFLLFLGLFSLCGIEAVAKEKKIRSLPPFCGSYECPRYQVLKRYNTFELRRYEPTRWVTTNLVTDALGLGIMKSFRRLYKYLNKENSEGISIKMNVPVRVTIPLTDPTANATMSLFMPAALPEPPTPNDSSLVLQSYASTYYFVRSFGGYAMKSDFEKHSKALSEELTTLGLAYDEQFGIAAAYNDPLTFYNRHNEVWFRSLNQ